MELPRSRPPIIIIRISDFKVCDTYICTSAHYTHYKICNNNTIFYKQTW